MENNDELKEVNIKNRTCYYFDDKNKIENFDFDNILIYGKSYKNIFVCDIWNKILLVSKPLRIRFDEVDRFIRVYDGIRYAIYKIFIYLVSQKSGITYVSSHNYAKIKVDSYDFLHLGKTLTFHSVIIPIKSLLDKDKNHYSYNKLLQKLL